MAQHTNSTINYSNAESINFLKLELNNASSLFRSSIKNYTYVNIGLLNTYSPDVFVVQKGNNITSKYFESESFTRTKNSVFMGGASYTNSIIKNVNWNNASDYNLVYPYVMADSIVGNHYKEKYSFNGSYSFLRNNTILGIQASYNASLEYKKQDPRPLNTCSDFVISTSSSFPITDTHLLGFNAKYRLYKQKNLLNIFNTNIDYSLFYMRGFGLDSKYFSENKLINENLYILNQYSFQGSLMPTTNKGIYFISLFKHSQLDFMLRNNSKQVSRLNTNSFTNEIAYKLITEKLSVRLLSDISLSKGLEYNYKITGEFFNTHSKYTRNIYSSVLSALYQTKNLYHNVYLFSLEHNSFMSEYKKDNSQEQIDKIILSAHTSFLFSLNKYSLVCKFNLKYANTLNSKLVMPRNLCKSKQNMITQNYIFLKSDYIGTGFSLRVNRSLTKANNIFTSIRYSQQNFTDYSHQYYLSLALGLSF